MSTNLQLGIRGLDQLGRSTLTIAELLHHMATVKKIALLDSPFHEIGAEPPRLVIQPDGTHAALPDRSVPLKKTLPATAALIDAMVRFAINPTDESATDVKRAEDHFDPVSLKCVQHAIYDACRSEEMEFRVNLEESPMFFHIPHKTRLFPTKKEVIATNNCEEAKITKIHLYLDAISSNGMAAFIRRNKSTPDVKAGDRIVLRMTRCARTFLRLSDAP